MICRCCAKEFLPSPRDLVHHICDECASYEPGDIRRAMVIAKTCEPKSEFELKGAELWYELFMRGNYD